MKVDAKTAGCRPKPNCFPEKKCPSCGLAWTEHVGVLGTCAALQCALSTLDKIAELKRQPNLMRGLAGSCATFIRTTLGK